MNELIAQQREFVEWLKAKGEYNALDSASTMQRMFEVWKAMKDEGKMDIRCWYCGCKYQINNLKSHDYHKCPECGFKGSVILCHAKN
jgi:DNA-directed RNA polymerase subunit RPC12/RpoP